MSVASAKSSNQELSFSYLNALQRLFFGQTLLLQKIAGSEEAIARAINEARVDLNPHQIEAAYFALRNPLNKGVILADEVGLGKTIEAGLVLGQLWAQGNRKILIVCPKSLRAQWSLELSRLFYLPVFILDRESTKQFKSDKEQIIITTDHFIEKNNSYFQVNWDLVVIDEAHRLRNVWKGKSASKRATKLRELFKPCRKLLLTATPMQNSLNELWGLSSFIDEHVLGTFESFSMLYSKLSKDEVDNRIEQLRERLKLFFNRELRKNVSLYIQFPPRRAVTIDYFPSEEEESFRNAVEEFLREEFALTNGKKGYQLAVWVYLKLLSSSLLSVKNSLKNRLERYEAPALSVELPDDNGDYAEELNTDNEPPILHPSAAKLQKLISRLELITQSSKGIALCDALKKQLEYARQHNWPAKAVIFTEFTTTQNFVIETLKNNLGYEVGKEIVVFNGKSGNSADRAALVEQFRDKATVFLTTEAGAEGLNLQFCNLVINYDLPWNPQRIEQRIGRCHRYGQKFEVVVLNFVNKSNPADERILKILSRKFNLFESTFGASDEVLGSLESGLNVESILSNLYLTCKSPEEIEESFNSILENNREKIDSHMNHAMQILKENFAAPVQNSIRSKRTQDALDARENLIKNLVCSSLTDRNKTFRITNGTLNVDGKIIPFRGSKDVDEEPLSTKHELFQAVIHESQNTLHLEIDASTNSANRHLEKHKGCKGTYWLVKLCGKSCVTEERLIPVVQLSSGTFLSEEDAKWILQSEGRISPTDPISVDIESLAPLNAAKRMLKDSLDSINRDHVIEESQKLDFYFDDITTAKTKEIDLITKEMAAVRKKMLTVDLKQQEELLTEVSKLKRKIVELQKEILDLHEAHSTQANAIIDKLKADLSTVIQTSLIASGTIEIL